MSTRTGQTITEQAKTLRCQHKVEVSASAPSRDVRFHAIPGGGGAQRRARSQSLLLPPAELGVGEPSSVTRALLGRNPGEDPIEVRVLDDCPGGELRVILREETGCHRAALGVEGHRAGLGLPDLYGGPPEAPGRDGIGEHVEVSLGVHRELATDPTRCVRLDLNAAYLGQQGQTPNCPARQIGHTDTVQIEPLNARSQPDAATATQAETVNGLNARVNPNATTAGDITVVFPDLQLVAVVTFGQSPALALQIVQTFQHA